MKDNSPKPRYHLLDTLRGFAVLCMVFYHGFYSVDMMLGLDIANSLFVFFMPLEPFFAALFIFISGVCTTLSSSNTKNGLKLLGVALGITVVTVLGEELMNMNMVIYFGVLHMLAICLLLAGFLEKAGVKYRFAAVALPVLLIVFIISYDLIMGEPLLPYLGLSAFGITVPYGFRGMPWLLPFGFPQPGIGFMADYFPLLPWAFMFFSGVCFAHLKGRGNLPRVFLKKGPAPLRWLGRHALIIYVVHQPVIFGVCRILNTLFGGAI